MQGGNVKNMKKKDMTMKCCSKYDMMMDPNSAIL